MKNISIHAPRAGRDSGARAAGRELSAISIHAPRAGRDLTVRLSAALGVISIHAPRAGRDLTANIRAHTLAIFQSTRPVRGATKPTQVGGTSCMISIHAPRAGRDLTGTGTTWIGLISIHAPRAGRDSKTAQNSSRNFVITDNKGCSLLTLHRLSWCFCRGIGISARENAVRSPRAFSVRLAFAPSA